jgi:hypothetical protein
MVVKLVHVMFSSPAFILAYENNFLVVLAMVSTSSKLLIWLCICTAWTQDRLAPLHMCFDPLKPLKNWCKENSPNMLAQSIQPW